MASGSFDALVSAVIASSVSNNWSTAVGKWEVAQLEEDPAGHGVCLRTEHSRQIVKAIACSEVKPERIAHRDQKSYFAVLLDDNNRKPIVRLWFNGKKQKYLGLFDENKVETRHPIDALDTIYEHAEVIRATVRQHAA